MLTCSKLLSVARKMITRAIIICKKAKAYLPFINTMYIIAHTRMVHIMPAEMIRPLSFILFLVNAFKLSLRVFFLV